MRGPALVLAYAAFAVLATGINLGTQRLVMAGTEDPVRLAIALVTGTLAGMAIKYALDSAVIFRVGRAPLAVHGERLGRYAGTSVITTLVFWACEAGAFALSPSELSRETGALIGLGLGYALKYALDRRLVFRVPVSA